MSRALRRTGLLTAALAFLADQLSKFLLLEVVGLGQFAPGQAIRITPFFNLVMVWNKGVSYGLFPANGLFARLFLIGFSLVIVVLLVFWLWRASRLVAALGIGLVVGGALGNVLDRIRFGAVADFFHFHAFGYDWYVFNIADAAIAVGAAFLVYESVFSERGHKRKPG